MPSVDKVDIDEQSTIEAAAGGLRERIRKKLAGSDTSDSSDSEDEDLEKGEQLSKKTEKKKEAREVKRAAERERAESARLETKKQGQGVPGDAFLEPKTVDKESRGNEASARGLRSFELR